MSSHSLPAAASRCPVVDLSTAKFLTATDRTGQAFTGGATAVIGLPIRRAGLRCPFHPDQPDSPGAVTSAARGLWALGPVRRGQGHTGPAAGPAAAGAPAGHTGRMPHSGPGAARSAADPARGGILNRIHALRHAGKAPYLTTLSSLLLASLKRSSWAVAMLIVSPESTIPGRYLVAFRSSTGRGASGSPHTGRRPLRRNSRTGVATA